MLQASNLLAEGEEDETGRFIANAPSLACKCQPIVLRNL